MNNFESVENRMQAYKPSGVMSIEQDALALLHVSSWTLTYFMLFISRTSSLICDQHRYQYTYNAMNRNGDTVGSPFYYYFAY